MALPAVLVISGVLAWFLGSEFGMVLGAAAGSAVGVFAVFDWLFRRAPTRFSTLMGIELLLGYALGTMNTWLTLPRGSYSLSEFMGLNDAVLAHGMGSVLICSALLFFLGEVFEKPIFGRDFRLSFGPKTRLMVYVGALATFAGFLTRRTSFLGNESTHAHPGIISFFLLWLSLPLTAMAVGSFIFAEDQLARVMSGLAALFLVLQFAVQGRRLAIYSAMEIVFVLGLAGYRWNERIIRKAFMIAGLAAVVVLCSLTFMLLRVAGGQAGLTKHATLEKRVGIAKRLVQQGRALNVATLATQQNVEKRTFVLAFLANVEDASFRMTPALGRDVGIFLDGALPRVLFPNKSNDMGEEDLVDEQFGFAYTDEANSIVTAGATDFGFIGMIVYPICMVALFKIMFNLLARWFSKIPLLFVVLSFIVVMMLTETTLGGYFEALRDAPLFCGILAVFLAIPGISGLQE
jgi:hypothetical protein